MLVRKPADIDSAAAAADMVTRTHEQLVEYLGPGRTLLEVDRQVQVILESLGCTSAFKGYRVRGHPPFPNQACLSVNDCIVHGTHDSLERPLEAGDIISVDIGVKYRGWIGDAAWTYGIEAIDDASRDLMECGKESLRRGVEQLQVGKPLIEYARSVQEYVEKEKGYFLTRGLGGHGYGRSLHDKPFISNVVPSYPGEWPDAWMPCEEGHLVAVEPMIALGTTETRTVGRTWPIWSADGSASVHYEADVLVTGDGPRNLTERMNQLPDIVD